MAVFSLYTTKIDTTYLITVVSSANDYGDNYHDFNNII